MSEPQAAEVDPAQPLPVPVHHEPQTEPIPIARRPPMPPSGWVFPEGQRPEELGYVTPPPWDSIAADQTTMMPRIRSKGPPVHDGLAIACFVMSLFWLGGTGSVIALILAASSRDEARRHDREPSGLTTAGLVLGWIGLTASFLIAAVLVAAAHNHAAHGGGAG